MSEEVIRIGEKVSESVACAGCGNTVVSTDAHSFRGKKGEDVHYCAECFRNIDAAFRAETANPNVAGAVVLGVLAGAAAGVIWFLVEIHTGYRLGYIALGAGYLVGLAVVWGAGKKRGSALQLISVAITFLSVVGASYFSAVHQVNRYLAAEMVKQGKPAIPYLWISPLHPDLVRMIVSPMGVLIWGIALYIAFRQPQPRKL